MGRVVRARTSTYARLFAFTVALAGGGLALAAVGAAPASATATRAPVAAATTVNIAITDTGFSPSTLDVAAGTVVVWTNDGASTHTVTALDGSFASDELQPGATFPFQFTKPGAFQYRDIHTGNSGAVTVVAGSLQGTATVPAAPTPAPGTPAPGAAATNPAGGPTMAFTGTGDYVLAAAGALLLAFGWSLTRRNHALIAPFRVDRETAHAIERARRCRSDFIPMRRRTR